MIRDLANIVYEYVQRDTHFPIVRLRHGIAISEKYSNHVLPFCMKKLKQPFEKIEETLRQQVGFLPKLRISRAYGFPLSEQQLLQLPKKFEVQPFYPEIAYINRSHQKKQGIIKIFSTYMQKHHGDMAIIKANDKKVLVTRHALDAFKTRVDKKSIYRIDQLLGVYERLQETNKVVKKVMDTPGESLQSYKDEYVFCLHKTSKLQAHKADYVLKTILHHTPNYYLPFPK